MMNIQEFNTSWFDDIVAETDKSKRSTSKKNEKTEMLLKVQNDILTNVSTENIDKVKNYFLEKKMSVNRDESITFSLLKESIVSNSLSVDIEGQKRSNVEIIDQSEVNSKQTQQLIDIDYREFDDIILSNLVVVNPDSGVEEIKRKTENLKIVAKYFSNPFFLRSTKYHKVIFDVIKNYYIKFKSPISINGLKAKLHVEMPDFVETEDFQAFVERLNILSRRYYDHFAFMSLIEYFKDNITSKTVNNKIMNIFKSSDEPIEKKMEYLMKEMSSFKKEVEVSKVVEMESLVANYSKDVFDQMVTKEDLDYYMGIDGLPQLWGGVEETAFILFVAFTSQLKTTTMVNACYHAKVMQKKNSIYYSMEMSEGEMRDIFVSAHSYFLGKPIPYEKIRNKKLSTSELKLIEEVTDDFENNPNYGRIYFVSEANITPSKVFMYYNEKKDYCKIHALYIDYIAYMEPDTKYAGMSRTDKENSIYKDLRGYNLDNKVRIISGAQSSREGYNRAVKNNGIYDITSISYANEAERCATHIVGVYFPEEFRPLGKVLYTNMKRRGGKLFNPFYVKVESSYSRITNFIGFHEEVKERAIGDWKDQESSILSNTCWKNGIIIDGKNVNETKEFFEKGFNGFSGLIRDAGFGYFLGYNSYLPDNIIRSAYVYFLFLLTKFARTVGDINRILQYLTDYGIGKSTDSKKGKFLMNMISDDILKFMQFTKSFDVTKETLKTILSTTTNPIIRKFFSSNVNLHDLFSGNSELVFKIQANIIDIVNDYLKTNIPELTSVKDFDRIKVEDLNYSKIIPTSEKPTWEFVKEFVRQYCNLRAAFKTGEYVYNSETKEFMKQKSSDLTQMRSIGQIDTFKNKIMNYKAKAKEVLDIVDKNKSKTDFKPGYEFKAYNLLSKNAVENKPILEEEFKEELAQKEIKIVESEVKDIKLEIKNNLEENRDEVVVVDEETFVENPNPLSRDNIQMVNEFYGKIKKIPEGFVKKQIDYLDKIYETRDPSVGVKPIIKGSKEAAEFFKDYKERKKKLIDDGKIISYDKKDL